MKTTDVSTLVEPKLIAAYNTKQGVDIQREYQKFERDMIKSLVLIFLLLFLGLCSGAKSMTLFGPFYASIFIPLENDIGGFARLVELLLNVLSPFVVSMLPLAIFYKFIPFFSDKNYGVAVLKFKKAISKFREHYYTGSPDVCLTEELIRENQVLMGRKILLENRTLEFLKSTGWTNQETLQEAKDKSLQAEQILNDSLASMDEFDLCWNKGSIFTQAKNA